ncbi:hypothetical protein CYMTET_13427, partial [Cymbomonas tetramitiformis]
PVDRQQDGFEDFMMEEAPEAEGTTSIPGIGQGHRPATINLGATPHSLTLLESPPMPPGPARHQGFPEGIKPWPLQDHRGYPPLADHLLGYLPWEDRRLADRPPEDHPPEDRPLMGAGYGPVMKGKGAGWQGGRGHWDPAYQHGKGVGKGASGVKGAGKAGGKPGGKVGGKKGGGVW